MGRGERERERERERETDRHDRQTDRQWNFTERKERKRKAELNSTCVLRGAGGDCER